MAWGGSEELWYRAARKLQDAGHAIAVNYKWWPNPSYQMQQLAKHGAEVTWRGRPPGFWQRKAHEAKLLLSPRSAVAAGPPREGRTWLSQSRPEAVLITIGYHPDQVHIAGDCHALRIPYAINVQCASSSAFIHADRVNDFRQWYQNAQKVFFVSEENRHKLETNLAVRLDNAEIVANPFNVKTDRIPAWPADQQTFHLACVGRIHFQSKGQDMIVDLMRQERWRERPLEVRFYGHDQGNRRQLEDLIRLHGLEHKMKVVGFMPDVNQIWAENHALLLPSRYEGAALVLVEAMWCQRVVIASDTGRNRELIDDGVSGFIARAATAELLDEALGRAWEERSRWAEIGQLAGQHIRERFPLDPVAEFARRLLELAPKRE
jgi:glycosyltransferase involved in cell wall biosynthesis